MIADSLDLLLELQEYDRKLSIIREKLRELPRLRKRAQEALEKRKELLQRAREGVKKGALHVRRLEAEIDDVRKKVGKLREQQMQIRSNEEYRALEKEIAQMEERIRVLEDDELNRMEALEQIEREAAEAEKEVKDGEGVLEADLRMLKDRETDLKQQEESIRRHREDIAGQVPARLRERYERILKHVGDYAVVPIENGNCGGCHMRLPMQVIYDAKKGLKVQTCSYCGRILYWKPD